MRAAGCRVVNTPLYPGEVQARAGEDAAATLQREAAELAARLPNPFATPFAHAPPAPLPPAQPKPAPALELPAPPSLPLASPLASPPLPPTASADVAPPMATSAAPPASPVVAAAAAAASLPVPPTDAAAAAPPTAAAAAAAPLALPMVAGAPAAARVHKGVVRNHSNAFYAVVALGEGMQKRVGPFATADEAAHAYDAEIRQANRRVVNFPRLPGEIQGAFVASV